jgi:predicted GIY-YIG superfamily endonuclease
MSQTGTVYLLHFDRPYEHARHYLGWASNLEARLEHHRAGTGGNLLRVLKNAGIGWKLARTWSPADRNRERQIKRQGGLSRSCPMCGVQPRAVA